MAAQLCRRGSSGWQLRASALIMVAERMWNTPGHIKAL
jgi:hypothetical protein